MRAVAILRNDHTVILEALDLLEQHARAVRAGAGIDREFARWILEFLGEFADDTHHAKEEGVLFGLLRRRGVPGAEGAIAGMLAEHEATRRDAEGLRRAVAQRQDEVFAETGIRLADEFRRHVLRENESLFGRAEALLTSADDAEALEAFGQVVHQREAALIRQRHLAAVERWRQAFRACAA
jgi:hemerythrin-like domain-containing protein